MPSKFTESLELARELLKIYHLQGADSFVECLQRYARLIVEDCQQDTRRLNTRFSTVVFGMLSILFVNDTERIMRQEVAVTEGFINEAGAARKADLFVRDVARFLREYEAERHEQAFSERLLMHLASCPLAELKEMTLSVLAERFDYHPNYLSNKFKKEKQFTVQEAILNEKLNRALFILRDETVRTSIKELSWRLGFSDPAYFSQLFKKRFGMLPKQIQAT